MVKEVYEATAVVVRSLLAIVHTYHQRIILSKHLLVIPRSERYATRIGSKTSCQHSLNGAAYTLSAIIATNELHRCSMGNGPIANKASLHILLTTEATIGGSTPLLGHKCHTLLEVATAVSIEIMVRSMIYIHATPLVKELLHA